MKRIISVLLVVVFCVTLLLPATVWGTEREEYIKLDKSTYLSGEYMEILYEFQEGDATRWICFYKGTQQASNMVLAMTATARIASNMFVPNVAVGMNGRNRFTPLEPGSYLMKIMYLPEGGDHTVAASFTEGEKSNLTYSFTVTANSGMKPTISIADREISKNGNLDVSFSGIVHTLEDRTLDVAIYDKDGKVVKTRQLWNGLYYAGISGTTTISLVGLAPGKYTVRLACNDSEFAIDKTAIEITITEQEEGSHTSIFPADLFKNKEICGRYFANADNPGNIYQEIDGEYVMEVPLHPGNDYMYTWEPIPYDTFTVTFDFLLHIEEEGRFADEMDFLFGMPKAGLPFHQVSMVNAYGSFSMLHYKHTGKTFENYEYDTMFYDLYEEEMWYTISFQITKDDVTVFVGDEELITLEDTANCIGEYGHIGLRGGSNAGWSIKNLTVREGLFDDEVPAPSTSEPGQTQSPENPETQAPATDAPAIDAPSNSTGDTEATDVPIGPDKQESKGLFLGIGVGAFLAILFGGIVLVAGIVVAVVILIKKKKKA